MNPFVIVTDSCSDLPIDVIKQYDIRIIPMLVHFKQETFRNLPDQSDISNHAFYQRLKNKEVAKTSQVNAQDFLIVVEPLIKEGLDILVITLSSGLSGSYDSIASSAQALKNKYPERNIIVIDSILASLGEGLLVYHAALLKEKGLSMQEVASEIENLKHHLWALFTVDELGTLMRGGRVSFAKAFLGTLLNMKPTLMMDKDGKLIDWSKARGRKNALNLTLNKMDELITNDEIIFISHGDNLEEAQRVANEIKKRHPNNKRMIIGEIGPVIGAHSGPGTIAVFFLGKERR